MTQSAKRFAELLQEGINVIADRTGKPKGVIRDELGYAIGRKGGSAIEYWSYGDGHIPRSQTEVAKLARALVVAGQLDGAWLVAFLESAGYPNNPELIAELFPATAAQPRHNLPLAPTPFVGRTQELADLTALLANPDCRLITLTGPGGSGKTRLAIEASRKVHATFLDGATFVALVSLTSAELVAPTIANALNLTFSSHAAPHTQLLHYLRNQSHLLVLDNFEQLLLPQDQLAHEATANPHLILIDSILTQASKVTLLVTSRERLNIQGEWVYDVAGLEVPPKVATGATLYSAPAFFVQTARRGQASFTPTPTDEEAIVRICQLVEGMPLALELAAAWIRVLSCQEIAAEIATGLDFLTAPQHNLTARHRSLRAVFDHSWLLLSGEERQVLARCSVFRGEFTREAANAVADVPLRLLSALINKSLLRRNPTEMYELHESIRQFAFEKLCLRNEAVTIQKRHEAYFVEQAENKLKQLSRRTIYYSSNVDYQPKQDDCAITLSVATKKRPMRVLMISMEYPPYLSGGVGKHVAELVRALGDTMVDDEPLFVDLLTVSFANEQLHESVSSTTTVYRVAVKGATTYQNILAHLPSLVTQAQKLFQQHEYVAIHAHDNIAGYLGSILQERYTIPLIIAIHGTTHGRFATDLSGEWDELKERERLVCNRAEHIIVTSQFMRQEVHAYLGVLPEKISIIPNGINGLTAPVNLSEKLAWRQKYAPSGEKLLYFVGPTAHEKGLHILIRAMRHILADHPDVRLLVASRHGHHLQPLVYELGLEEAIEFLGYISDEHRDILYQVVDAVIIPSLYEPFGLVALEAMAFGCPVIASDAGGLGEVIKHQQNGLLISPGDPATISRAVHQLFVDPAGAHQRRCNALHEVKTVYRWNRVALQTANLYKSLTS